MLEQHVEGRRAVDFGCGTGRSTRFLQKLGYATRGLDVSSEMVAIAREHGAAAKLCGSGGAIVGAPAAEADMDFIERVLRDRSFEVLRPQIALPPAEGSDD